MFGGWCDERQRYAMIHKMHCRRLNGGGSDGRSVFGRIGVYDSFDDAYRHARQECSNDVVGCEDCRPNTESRVDLPVDVERLR